jgi:hypothetical protein
VRAVRGGSGVVSAVQPRQGAHGDGCGCGGAEGRGEHVSGDADAQECGADTVAIACGLQDRELVGRLDADVVRPGGRSWRSAGHPSRRALQVADKRHQGRVDGVYPLGAFPLPPPVWGITAGPSPIATGAAAGWETVGGIQVARSHKGSPCNRGRRLRSCYVDGSSRRAGYPQAGLRG